MHLEKFEDINEIHGQRIGVSSSSDQYLTGEGMVKDGEAFIDCLPAMKGKYVIPIPNDATICTASSNDAPYPFMLISPPSSSFIRFIDDCLSKLR